ncbi:16S rRNA (cytosine(967)-C(5))-methyltransferase RsmB [uncultured Helcococcus sp.]|uniref:16S rRNA (cytosine(967)-C(5))-methyltransferase RsmB n=1 Tax=uncultured Helcococcus sp. TaxID=1072508 RepID=UPI00288922BA|nr:16S rRNA (cytosine(967)-C(5))-methyltransferase RsmB [uncultured Helcococcus sp.]
MDNILADIVFFILEVVIKARRQAVYALDKILNQDQYSTEIINELVDKVVEIDKPLFRKLVYGVVENLYYIDYMIGKLSKIKINKLDKNVLNILRIAVYELTFLESKPYAVINEAVNLCKKFSFKSKGFVNGVLRNLDRNKEKIMEIEEKGDKYLSIKYSTNMDIIKYLKDNYSNYKEIVASFSDQPDFTIRVNTYLISKEDLKAKLEKLDFKIENSNKSPDALLVENPNGIIDTDEFNKGYFTIQDQASALVGNVVNPKMNSKVLDLCAAPGSKSTHMAQIMKNTGEVLANDISTSKNEKIIENFQRLQLTNYELKNYDASKNVEEFENTFDYVLVDAPCSGLGVIKRKPEIKLYRTYEDILSIASIQKEILDRAYSYVKKGGDLIYSTCTIGKLENQDIIKDFINKHPDIKIVPIDGNDYKEILPNKSSDGFYICKMTKIL